MTKFIYKGITYNSKKELREATGLSRTKINAKVKDNEITLILNTGVTPYENNQEPNF